MTRQEKIYDLISSAFNPELLEVQDESMQHSGHVGSRPEGETHFYVKVVSKSFANLSRVEIHRKINNVLKDEFNNGLHALRIDASPKLL